MKIKFFAPIAVVMIVLTIIGGMFASAFPIYAPSCDNIATTDETTPDAAPLDNTNKTIFYDEYATEVVGYTSTDGYWMLDDGIYTVNFNDGSTMQLHVDDGSWCWRS